MCARSSTTAEPAVTPPQQPEHRRRRWTHEAAVVGGMVAAIAAVLLITNCTTDAADPPAADAFPSGWMSMEMAVPVPVNEFFLAAMRSDEYPEVTLRHVEPILAPDSVAVSTELVGCTPHPGAGAGSIVADISSVCRTVQGTNGLDLSSLDDDAFPLLVVMPLADGPVNLDGIEISYDDGGQDFSQPIDWKITLPAR